MFNVVPCISALGAARLCKLSLFAIFLLLHRLLLAVLSSMVTFLARILHFRYVLAIGPLHIELITNEDYKYD